MRDHCAFKDDTDICDTNMATAGFVFEFNDDKIAVKWTANGEEILQEYNGYSVGEMEKETKKNRA